MSHQKILLRLLLVYGLLLILSIAGNLFFIHSPGHPLSLTSVSVSAIANATLTHGALAINFIPSVGHILFVILILQATGLLFNATLFWQCRQLFGDSAEKKTDYRDAFITTFWITLISQILLIVFFLYSIPASGVYEGRKILAAIVVATGSFHMSGIPFYNSFFTNTLLEQNFVLQLGITGGITLGSLGIFVIHELFSIRRLRQRLADTTIDWSFITKVSVFIGGLTIIISSFLYWFLEKDRLLSGKNITESAIASIYEVSALRGFGVSIFDDAEAPAGFTSFVSMALAGPFSNGGGMTLLIFVTMAFVLKSSKRTPEIRITGLFLWMLVVVSGISLIVASFGYLFNSISSMQIISAFTGNSVDISPDITWHSGVWISWLMVTGKLSPVIAAFWFISLIAKSRR